MKTIANECLSVVALGGNGWGEKKYYDKVKSKIFFYHRLSFDEKNDHSSWPNKVLSEKSWVSYLEKGQKLWLMTFPEAFNF